MSLNDGLHEGHRTRQAVHVNRYIYRFITMSKVEGPKSPEHVPRYSGVYIETGGLFLFTWQRAILIPFVIIDVVVAERPNIHGMMMCPPL